MAARKRPRRRDQPAHRPRGRRPGHAAVPRRRPGHCARAGRLASRLEGRNDPGLPAGRAPAVCNRRRRRVARDTGAAVVRVDAAGETMVAMNPGSATTKGESLWPRLAGLPLVIAACEYERLHAVLAYEFERSTTHVRLVGAGVDELGEDV